MKKSSYILTGLASAAGTVLYVSGVAWLMFNGEHMFGQKEDNFLMPVLLLLLFVISAAVTGLLVLGKPVHLYLSGLKKEALTLLLTTLGWLVIFLIAIVIFLAQ